MLKFRCWKILEDILIAPYGIGIITLAEKYQISEQSIKYDIYAIRKWIKEEVLEIHLRCSENKLNILGSKQSIQKLYQTIQEKYKVNYVTAEKRKDYIVFSLLNSDKYLTIKYFAEKLSVSESTIIRDMSKIEHFLYQDLHIKLEKKCHWGMRVIASETERRQTIEYYIYSIVNINEIVLNNEEKLPMFFCKTMHEYFFPHININQFESAIQIFYTNFFNLYKNKIDLEKYIEIIVRLCISIKQIKKKLSFETEYKFFTAEETLYLVKYDDLNHDIKNVFHKFGINVDDKEIQWIMLPILVDTLSIDQNDFKKVEEVVMGLIDEVSAKLKIPFHMDEKLYNNILIYVNKIILRRKFNLTNIYLLENNFVNRFKTFSAVMKDITIRIFHEHSIEITKEEMSFIALYFYFSCERLCEKKKIKTLIVVGINSPINELLIESITNKFSGLQIITSCLEKDMNKMVKRCNIQFVITTIPLKTNINNILVNRCLEKEDIWNIYKKMMEIKKENYNYTN